MRPTSKSCQSKGIYLPFRKQQRRLTVVVEEEGGDYEHVVVVVVVVRGRPDSDRCRRHGRWWFHWITGKKA
jgi:hypothetical protein